MQNKPGISWGPDAHINLIRSSKGWLAVYYDDEFSKPEIIRVFKLRNVYDKIQMMDTLAYYNYNTCRLCPLVMMEIDTTS